MLYNALIIALGSIISATETPELLLNGIIMGYSVISIGIFGMFYYVEIHK